MPWTLTARGRWRRGWFGRAVLTVEEERRIREPADMGNLLMYWRTERRWRDAKFRDLQTLDVQLKPSPRSPSDLVDRAPMSPGTASDADREAG